MDGCCGRVVRQVLGVAVVSGSGLSRLLLRGVCGAAPPVRLDSHFTVSAAVVFFCLVFVVVHHQLAPSRAQLFLDTSSASVCDVGVTLGSIMSGPRLRHAKCWFTFKRSDYFKGSLIIFKVN